jgi:hypothetical protein
MIARRAQVLRETEVVSLQDDKAVKELPQVLR